MIERFLLALLLLSKGWHFFRAYGVETGYDSPWHLEVVQQTSWFHQPGLTEAFYAYHPVLGFLLAKFVSQFGFSLLHSVQILSFIASLAAVLFFRATLQRIGLLRRPAGMACLYLTSSLPVQVHLETSVNLDILVMSFTTIALYLSVRLFWNTAPGEELKKQRLLVILALVGFLTCAMLTKFSGLVSLALPVLVAAIARPAFSLRRLVIASLIALAAIALAFPYYYFRYYRASGTFIAHNGDLFIKDRVDGFRKDRDLHRAEFFHDLFTEGKVHRRYGPTRHDLGRIRLYDAWRDFWMEDELVGSMTPMPKALSYAYLRAASPLMLLGAALFLWRGRRTSAWQRFGFLLIGFALVEALALIDFVYGHPLAFWAPAKGIYVSPVGWAISYLAAVVLTWPIYGCARFKYGGRAALALALALFTVANHVIPIY